MAMDAPADPRHVPEEGHPPEGANERHDRQLAELLNELRVALPGVQMLFGFLLAVPFSQRFSTLDHTQRNLYYATFLAAALASACFIAPASFHRIVWRRNLKRTVVHISSRLAIAGTVFLAAAITGSVVLVTSLLFGTGASAAAGGTCAGLIVALWYAVPLAYRLRAGGGAHDR
jgi:cation transport ATPase